MSIFNTSKIEIKASPRSNGAVMYTYGPKGGYEITDMTKDLAVKLIEDLQIFYGLTPPDNEYIEQLKQAGMI